MIKNRFDKVAQQEGKWFDYDDAKFLLASVKSKAFQKAYAEATADGDVDEDKLVESLHAVLLDWEGMLDEDGETPLEFSSEEAHLLLTDDEDFRAWAMQTVINQDNYKREIVKKKAKK